MNEVVMIDRSQTEQILQTAIEHKVTAIMSYLSKGKWHVAKVFATAIEAGKLSVQTMHSQDKQHPINININQPVGVSFKYEYGKFVFDTTVVGLEPARPGGADTGGTLVLAVPEEIEVIQRRSYFRVEVPKSLKVNVTLWRRKSGDGRPAAPPSRQTPQVSRASCPRTEGGTPSTPGGDQGRYARGRLVDISAGGAQIVLDDPGDGSPGEPHFRTGQFIGIRFTPLPYETPLVLNAQIRNALPRADGDSIYLGLQIVGLEASPEGRQVLARLVGVGAAKELVLTGELISAAEAKQIGLINSVVPLGQLMAKATEYAQKILQRGPLAVGLAKQVINTALSVDAATGRTLERLAQSILLKTEDAEEGFKAFREKRPPKFSGK